jgi:Flp pilus assembly pilin Flp
LRSLHRDEQGADLIEYILIIAAIALPVVAVIIWFRKDIGNWIGNAYEDVKEGEGQNPLDD